MTGRRASTAGLRQPTGLYDPKPYYLRLTKPQQPDPPANPDPNVGTTYSIGDGGPSAADQRAVVDPSFLELVRLGIKRYNHRRSATPSRWSTASSGGHPDRALLAPLQLRRLRRDTHGRPWDLSPPNSFRTIGRIWPIFAGERGEYELLAEMPAPPPGGSRRWPARPTRAG